MRKLLQVLSELNKGNSCKLYLLDNGINMPPNHYILFNFKIGDNGQLEISKETEVYDRPYFIRGEINKAANVREQMEMIRYPGDNMTTPISTLLYCSLFKTDDLIVSGARGKISYLDNTLALNQLFALASSMLSVSENGTTKFGYDIVDSSMLQIIKGSSDSFYTKLAEKAKYFNPEDDRKLSYSEMVQKLEDSLDTFADKFDQTKSVWDRINNFQLDQFPSKK